MPPGLAASTRPACAAAIVALLGVIFVVALRGAPPAGAQVVPGVTVTTRATTTTTTAPATSTTAAPATTASTAPPDTFTTSPPGDVPFVPAPIDQGLTTTPEPEPTPVPTGTTLPRRRVARPSTSLVASGGLTAAAVSGVYGLAVATILLSALGLVALASAIRPGGLPVSNLRTNRLILGAGCLALAAIVGLLGYLKLSLEPAVNRQIPYLASAGMALVILAVLGGALIVGEQMRTDQSRIEELEKAVERLADNVGAGIERPARTRARS